MRLAPLLSVFQAALNELLGQLWSMSPVQMHVGRMKVWSSIAFERWLLSVSPIALRFVDGIAQCFHNARFMEFVADNGLPFC